jgi:hypothetical protein
MPNLEYSVRFVLASDATAQIDDALRRMRESGSTITVKVNADTSGVVSEMKKVSEEVDKVASTTSRLGTATRTATSAAQKQFNALAKDIAKAYNQFSALPDASGAEKAFDSLSDRVVAYGKRLQDAGKDQDTYYKLLRQLRSAQEGVNSAFNNSSKVLAQGARAQRLVGDNVRGTIAELRRLSVEGKAGPEQLSRLFNRSASDASSLILTTEDLTKAFAQQRIVVEASNLSYKQKQYLLNQLKVAEEQATQSLRVANKGLSQQEQGVGDVSYAMLSFTRLLEDVPYGFRGFANNIQPTVFGLVQLNEVTIKANEEFRRLHGREMPLAQRAMLNLKTSLRSPINQILLLTSAVAVLGTFIEQWQMSSKRASQATKSLSDDFLRLFDAVKGDNPLDIDYSQSVKGLEEYSKALESAIEEIDKVNVMASDTQERIRSAGAREFLPTFELTKEEEKRLAMAKSLSKEAKTRLESVKAEAELQRFILGLESTRSAIQAQANARRVADAQKELLETNELIRIERVRQQQGEESAIRLKYQLMAIKLVEDETLSIRQAGLIIQAQRAQMDLELLRLSGKDSANAKNLAFDYKDMLESLRRRLEDEGRLTNVQRTQIDRNREIADLQADIAKKRLEGVSISVDSEKELIRLVNERYDLIDKRQREDSKNIVKSLAGQVALSDLILRSEQQRLLGSEEQAIRLDFQAMELEHQLNLSRAIMDINNDMSILEEHRADAIKNMTDDMLKQYQTMLLMSELGARRDVTNFLRSGMPDNEITRIEESKNQALLSQEVAYQAQLASIKSKYANDEAERRKQEEEATIIHTARLKHIQAEGAKQTADVTKMQYIGGAMMITNALEGFARASEARNRKAFEQQKAFSASMATINTLLAITQVLSDKNLTTFMKVASATAIGISGFAQVRQILATKYGGASTRADLSSQAQGFQEVEAQPIRSAMAGIGATASRQAVMNNITVTGNVDREGIYFLVNEGNDSVSSRATFAT